MPRQVKPKESQPDFGRRLEEALTHAKQSRKALAAYLGVTPQSIGQVINGPTVAMAADNSVRAARFLGVSAHWLATGEGSMLEGSDARESPGVYISYTAMDTAALQQLLLDLRDLLPEDREHFVAEIGTRAEQMRRYRDAFSRERNIPAPVSDDRVAQHIKPAPQWKGDERRHEAHPVERDQRRVYFDYDTPAAPQPSKKRGRG